LALTFHTLGVIPAKAGIQGNTHRRPWPWIPACAGMTAEVAETPPHAYMTSSINRGTS